MKKYLKTLGIATALTVSSFAANAINVGGVTWDPDHPLDFSGVTAVMHQDVDAAGVISGYGVITTLNGQAPALFCAGCELTFKFGGFTPIGGALLPGDAAIINYTGGFLDMFVDETPDAPLNDHGALTAANTGDDGGANALWLSLAGHPVGVPGITFDGFTIGTLGAGGILAGLGRFDVTGGLAADHIDTNTVMDGAGGFADLNFSTSFTINVTATSADGSGTFQGDSIPEPATLSIFGLGLLGMSAFARRRKAK